MKAETKQKTAKVSTGETVKKEEVKKVPSDDEEDGAGGCAPEEVDGCAVFWLALFVVTMVIYLAGFIAPDWRENDEVTKSGLWKICAYDYCYDFVGDSRIPKSGHLKATQTFMCFSFFACLLATYGHIGWVLSPFNPMYRGCAWSGGIIAGLMNGIAVLIYGVWLGHRPEGWAYWCSVYSATALFLNGTLAFCTLRSIDAPR
ncbi:hypothetical protein CAPTEDRAFT_222669 [Capitella teleta]|uniref:Uncharacterized protein n=1 Tax=Capitella teleta TaxID=283909 RepID=R7TP36_CAPTE|nr:hypothetical protein CAPTEDRAFT_222669 [Capitella teleta]|eukprot:ELT95668.1 hypothetical protein CAPTEDRAFT_222669 [Capitella teleta]